MNFMKDFPYVVDEITAEEMKGNVLHSIKTKFINFCSMTGAKEKHVILIFGTEKLKLFMKHPLMSDLFYEDKPNPKMAIEHKLNGRVGTVWGINIYSDYNSDDKFLNDRMEIRTNRPIIRHGIVNPTTRVT